MRMPSEEQNREALARAAKRGAKINGQPDPKSAAIIRKCQREVVAEAEAEAAKAAEAAEPDEPQGDEQDDAPDGDAPDGDAD